jgi:hypothetical protein
MKIAEQLHVQSQDEAEARRTAAPAGPSPDPAKPKLTAEQRAAQDPTGLAFDRVSRAVQTCMALSLKFYKDRLEREKKSAADHAAAEQERKPRQRSQLKRLVIEAVKRRDDRDSRDEFSLLSKMHDRLKEEDIERDLARYPLSELIARICRDLGIEPVWELWETEYWALEEARLKPPGSPYARPPASEPEKPKPEAPPQPHPGFDRTRTPSLEQQREREAILARYRARCGIGS